MPFDRQTLSALAERRLAEAKLLAERGEPSGAYYLAGYAIECALKSRIAGRFQANEIPDKNFVNAIYTHDLARLIQLAGLQTRLDAASEGIRQKWAVANNWSEQSRYEIWTQEAASAMIGAVVGGNQDEGLFQWLTAL